MEPKDREIVERDWERYGRPLLAWNATRRPSMPKVSALGQAILAPLAVCMQEGEGTCTVTIGALAAQLFCSEERVRRALSELLGRPDAPIRLAAEPVGDTFVLALAEPAIAARRAE